MWFTEANFPRIGRITMAGVITEFPIVASAVPDIAAGSDGALWFTDLGKSQLGRITTAGAVSYLPLPNGINCDYITSGPDGELWCGAFNQDAIARMATDGGAASFPIATTNALIRGIASAGAPEFDVDKIARVTLQ
jgi:virginiamycin B lyase